jgi:hypothetical protein
MFASKYWTSKLFISFGANPNADAQLCLSKSHHYHIIHTKRFVNYSNFPSKPHDAINIVITSQETKSNINLPAPLVFVELAFAVPEPPFVVVLPTAVATVTVEEPMTTTPPVEATDMVSPFGSVVTTPGFSVCPFTTIVPDGFATKVSPLITTGVVCAGAKVGPPGLLGLGGGWLSGWALVGPLSPNGFWANVMGLPTFVKTETEVCVTTEVAAGTMRGAWTVGVPW